MPVEPMILRNNTQDLSVLQSVYLGNEYRLDGEFGPDDVIIDVGGHIGCFALACLDRGAGQVHSYEPHPDNFRLLQRNLGRYPAGRAHAHHAAVWRSDVQEPLDLYQPHNANYTAMAQTRAACRPNGLRVVSLDDILRPFPRVRLLKLDCEGAEFPILYTCTQLHRVEEVAGEGHDQIPWKDSPVPCTTECLVEFLWEQGFDAFTELNEEAPELISWFFARRPS